MDAKRLRALIKDERTSEQIMSIGKRLADSMFHVHGENVEILREAVCASFNLGATAGDDPEIAVACTDAHYHNHQGAIMNGMALIAFTVGLITFVSLDKKMEDLIEKGELADYLDKLRKEVENEN